MPFARRLTVAQVRDIRAWYRLPASARSMTVHQKAAQMGVCYETLRRAGLHATYKWVGRAGARRRWVGTRFDGPVA